MTAIKEYANGYAAVRLDRLPDDVFDLPREQYRLAIFETHNGYAFCLRTKLYWTPERAEPDYQRSVEWVDVQDPSAADECPACAASSTKCCEYHAGVSMRDLYDN